MSAAAPSEQQQQQVAAKAACSSGSSSNGHQGACKTGSDKENIDPCCLGGDGCGQGAALGGKQPFAVDGVVAQQGPKRKPLQDITSLLMMGQAQQAGKQQQQAPESLQKSLWGAPGAGDKGAGSTGPAAAGSSRPRMASMR